MQPLLTIIQAYLETRAQACERRLPLWRAITGQDQIADLKMRVLLVHLAQAVWCAAIDRMLPSAGRVSDAA